jgi:SnoaL-like domain
MKVIDRYINSWNETDPAARRALIDEVWAEHGRYTDPLAVAEGRDAIDAVQGQFPGLQLRAGPVDAHHDIARFTWTLGADGAEPMVVGLDVAVLTDDNRIAAVHGFLDKVPA